MSTYINKKNITSLKITFISVVCNKNNNDINYKPEFISYVLRLSATKFMNIEPGMVRISPSYSIYHGKKPDIK